MARRKAAGFRALRACLASEYDRISEWSDVILHANLHLVGPELFRRLKSYDAASIDQEAVDYLESQYIANQERNQRIFSQLEEIGEACRNEGLRPTLIKGAAVIAQADVLSEVTRVSSDVDIVFPLSEIDAARSMLARLGYEIMPDTAWGHSIGSFARKDVVAAVDLHHELAPDIDAIVSIADLEAQKGKVQVGGTEFAIPNPSQHVLLNVAHEMLHDRNLAKGFSNLRYLFEIEAFMAEPNAREGLEDAALKHPKLMISFELQNRLARHLLNRELFPWAPDTLLGKVLHIRRLLKLEFTNLGELEWAALSFMRR